MTLFYAGATHADQSRVREQIRVTLKRPKTCPSFFTIRNMCENGYLKSITTVKNNNS
jgi:hypothetical protein